MGQPLAHVGHQRQVERTRPVPQVGMPPAQQQALKDRIALTLLWLAVVPLTGLWVIGLITVVRWIF